MGITAEIAKLKKERNAVILVHNYQPAEAQDIGDFVGDSLGLSQEAAKTAADIIVFCGVHFMAETASIICPGKKVLVPDLNAGCPMANMASVKELRARKAAMPDRLVVTYVNSSATVKAESDICCTSANAVRVVESLPESAKIFFVPDRNLGDYVREKTGRDIEAWNGYCPTHERILKENIEALKRAHPAAAVVIHPECTRDVRHIADRIASTTGILDFARETAAKEIIVGTEIGIIHRLMKENPGKKFYAASPLADCPNMKLTTPEKILWSLRDMEYEVKVEEPVRSLAYEPIRKMLDVSKSSRKD